MGGKKISPQERLARLKKKQSQRGTDFSGSKPPAEPIRPTADEETRAEKPKPPPVPKGSKKKPKPPPPPPREPTPIEMPEQPELGEALETMNAQELLRVINEVCRTENITTHEQLAGKHPEMALEAMKKGTYEAKIGEHAERLKDVVCFLQSIGVEMATDSQFAKAVSRCLCADCFDVRTFMRKSKSNLSMFERRRCVDDYMNLIEEIYNKGTAMSKRLPVAFEANKAVRMRSPIQLDG